VDAKSTPECADPRPLTAKKVTPIFPIESDLLAGSD
jgi:hypothetical protein